MKEIHLWNFIRHHLSQNHPVILLAVVHHDKGSPGKEGFKMAVTKSGESVGSIGGGVMEYNILKNCTKLFKENFPVNTIETLFHNRKSTSTRSGLICAGSQTNFTLRLNKKDISVVDKILNSLRHNQQGKIIFSSKGISFSNAGSNKTQFVFDFKDESNWRYEQSTGTENILYVIGGGHVGLAVSKIMSLLDFYVIVYDSRDNLQTMNENIYADKKIISPYEKLGKIIKENSFVVIVTTGFESDKEALEQVITKKTKYIGLMGTKVKIKKIFNEAVKDGVKKELLKKVRAPIGIDINSDTPEEIAVSIAAEIIKIKNSNSS
ncbi:MAG: XdhC family protein [bacterium]|nr:XdhC family protein [bacterium]